MRPKSIDEEFNDSYQNQGLQPHGLGGGAANDTDENLRRSSNYAGRYQAANDAELPIAGRRKLEGANDNTSAPIEPVYTPQNNRVTQKYLQSSNKSTEGIALSKKALRTAARAKIIATNTGIYSWAVPVWFFIQLPLALFALGFMGLAGVADGLLNSNADGSMNFAGIIVNYVVGGSLSFFDSLAGTNLVELTDPRSYAVALTSLTFILGMIKLFTIGLIYEITFVNSIFGRGASIKIIALILAVFGYFFPFLNLFPWFFIWTFTVALYPR